MARSLRDIALDLLEKYQNAQSRALIHEEKPDSFWFGFLEDQIDFYKKEIKEASESESNINYDNVYVLATRCFIKYIISEAKRLDGKDVYSDEFIDAAREILNDLCVLHRSEK